MADQPRPRARPRRRQTPRTGVRRVDYHRLVNRLPRAKVLAPDRVAAIHDAALEVPEELGIRVLLDEARRRYRAAGTVASASATMPWSRRTIQESSSTSAPAARQRRLAEFAPPPMDPGVVEALDAFVARRRAEGGASPVE